ncbi:MOSC domain-containing protein [Gephyromycinifex aptenodytis]|uniref:MOSC domain-containing protein n=1 Tax=Gephyromycinifex aptenodytis TaxID=2716227 RepID=UPI001447AA13|nr:MOSC domain-containing protein [Gephyromycinifex aptenodytis]
MTISCSGLYRYPVKAVGGEALRSVAVTARGLEGDRAWAVHEADGRLATGKNGRRFRRRDALFELRASTRGDEVHVVGPGDSSYLAGGPETDTALSALLGAPVGLRREEDGSHFDDSPVSLVGSASLRAAAQLLGQDEPLAPTRIRANLVLDTVEPYAEEGWLGRRLGLGSAVFVATEPIVRCRMVDIAQVGLPAQAGLLRALGQHRQTCLAIYLRVQRPGHVQVGDQLRLL